MQYSLFPEGLYHNIVRGAQLGVPMYVSEIGCADASADDRIRLVNIETSMHQVWALCCLRALCRLCFLCSWS